MITDRGFEVTFRERDAIVLDKNRDVLLRADRVLNLYHVRKSQNTPRNAEIKMAEKNSIAECHEKLGHLNEHDLKQMAKSGGVYGLNIKGDEKLTQYEVCLREKQTSTPFPEGMNERTENLLEIVHTDLCGPMRHSSFSGKKYFVTFMDDKSRWCEVYFVKNESEISDAFKQYKAKVENLTGNIIKILQSDNGKEYMNREFDAYLKTQGLKKRLTVPYTLQQNSIAVRINRMLVEMARCMMRQAGSPPAYWAEAINIACYVRNRYPTSELKGEIPFKLWENKTPTVNYIKLFDSKVYVLDKNPQKKI